MLYVVGQRKGGARQKVIVIGGGTSGLMASVSAAMHGTEESYLARKIPTLGKVTTGGTL